MRCAHAAGKTSSSKGSTIGLALLFGVVGASAGVRCRWLPVRRHVRCAAGSGVHLRGRIQSLQDQLQALRLSLDAKPRCDRQAVQRRRQRRLRAPPQPPPRRNDCSRSHDCRASRDRQKPTCRQPPAQDRSGSSEPTRRASSATAATPCDSGCAFASSADRTVHRLAQARQSAGAHRHRHPVLRRDVPREVRRRKQPVSDRAALHGHRPRRVRLAHRRLALAR